jgi:exonuclease III
MSEQSLSPDTSTEPVHASLLRRLQELITEARQPPATPHEQGESRNHLHNPTTVTTQPMTPHHPTVTQRLQIAQQEWSKLFSTTNRPTESEQIQARPTTFTSENHRQNISWGDLLEEKNINATRIYSLNVNGLSIDRRGGRFDDLCKVSKEVNADIICCQEHNLDTSKSYVRNILYDTARQHWPRSRMVFGTTPIQFCTNYKPGGTMMVSVGDVTGRIIARSQDKWGRWTSQTFRGTGNTNLTVISAYQVVTDNPHTGLTTATSQQQSLLIQSNESISPRKAFKRDVRLFIQNCISQGDEVLIVGDFNEPLGSEIDGMSRIAAEFHLVSLMQVRHQHNPPATYTRGKRCLDYGLATRRVANAMVRCGYESFNERFATDHRAYFFDLDNNLLFGNIPQPFASPTLRVLKSNNAEQVTQYIKAR